MDINTYQRQAARTIPDTTPKGDLKTNAILGICGEGGELADMHKKALFQGHAYTEYDVADEIGDVLWYLAALCTAYDLDLAFVARANLEKLYKRYPDGFSKERSVNRDGGALVDVRRVGQLAIADYTEGNGVD